MIWAIFSLHNYDFSELYFIISVSDMRMQKPLTIYYDSNLLHSCDFYDFLLVPLHPSKTILGIFDNFRHHLGCK